MGRTFIRSVKNLKRATTAIAMILTITMLIAPPLIAAAKQDQEAQAGAEQAQAVQRKIPLEKLIDFENPVVIAKYGEGQELTNVELYRKLTDRPRSLAKSALELFKGDPEKELKPRIDETIAHQIIYEQAVRDPEVQYSIPPKTLATARDTAINRIILNEEVLAKFPPITEQQIEEAYNLQRADFTTPFQFRIRSIFLMTYEPYTVQQGDTLEAIATKISGDPALAERIIDAATKESRAGSKPTKTTREKAVIERPLQEGEKLLAPMNKQKIEEVRLRMAELKKKLDEGGDFQLLAREYTEDPSQGELSIPLPSGSKPMLPEIFKTAQELPVGSYSDILHTKHGFQIIKMEEKQEVRITPLEEVHDQIKASLETNAREQGVQNFWNRLMEAPELKINMENLMANNAPDDLEIASLRSFKYFWRDLRADNQLKGIPAGQEDRLKALKSSQRLNREVYALFVEQQRYMERQEVKNAVELAQKEAIIAQYLNQMASQRLNNIDEAILRELYEKNKEQLKRPVSFRVYEIIQRVGTDPKAIAAAKAELSKVKEQIKTLAEMRQTATTAVNHFEPLRRARGLMGEVEGRYRGIDFIQQLIFLELGQVHGPFEGELAEVPDVFLIWIEERLPERIPSFEEAKAQLSADYKQNQFAAVVTEIVQEVARAAKIEYLY